MKKTVLAFAVAAAMGVPAVAAADTTLYGRFNVSLDRVDNDTTKSTQLASNSSRIGVRGSEDLGGGLRGVFQMEASMDVTTGAGGTLASRNSFVGLAGDFGELRVGRHDSPYKMSTLRLNMLADSLMDIHNIMGSTPDAPNALFGRENNVILYMSPNFDGFQAMVSYTTDSTADTPTIVDQGDTVQNPEANDRDRYSIAGSFTSGPIFVTAAYEKHNNVSAATEAQAWKIGGSYQIDDLTLGALYENIEVGNDDRNAWNLSARYNMGQVYLAATYAQAGDFDGADTGAKMYGLGAGYNFSRRTGVYASYAQVDNDRAGTYGLTAAGKGKGVAASDGGADVSGFQVGVWHNF